MPPPPSRLPVEVDLHRRAVVHSHLVPVLADIQLRAAVMAFAGLAPGAQDRADADGTAPPQELARKAGLSHGFREARGFYLIIVAATGIGTVMGYLELDPLKALVWSAIVNGVISVPIMAVLMWIGQSERLMGEHTITLRHRCFGWAATGVMAVAVLVMLVTSF